MTTPRRKRNSSKVNLTISLAFHSVIIAALFFFAAREGLLGKQLKKIAVTMAPKEKPPDKPKEKPPEPKVETAKAETPKVAEAPKTAAPKLSNIPPPPSSVPVAAPPPSVIPSLQFGDGPPVALSSSDPVVIYKGVVERRIKMNWNKPDNAPDNNYVAEAEVSIDASDPSGKINGSQFLKGSGDQRWDSTVKEALARTKSVGRKPPKGFPGKFLVRFDVLPDSEPLLQSSNP